MATGTGVIKVRKDSGFGFITPDGGGKDLFFHVKDLARGTREDQMAEGVRVAFEVRQGDRGPMACQVYVLPADFEPEPARQEDGISVDEAIRGLKDALLVTLQWVDALDEARKAEA
jgi:cold shock protein